MTMHENGNQFLHGAVSMAKSDSGYIQTACSAWRMEALVHTWERTMRDDLCVDVYVYVGQITGKCLSDGSMKKWPKSVSALLTC